MVKKLMGVFFAAALVLGMGLRANAAERTGSIRISMDVGDLPVINGAMTLYQVGTPMEGGYRISDRFGGGIVKEADADSPHLAKWLAEGAGETGKTVYLDVDGNVTFSGLEEGLYLVVQPERIDGFYAVNPFLLPVPEYESWDIQVNLAPNPIIAEDNPKTGQHPAPFLAAMVMVGSGVGIYLCIDGRRKK